MNASKAAWEIFRREAGNRLQPEDPGYVVWSQAKQDLFDVVQDAIDNKCNRVFGTFGPDGLPAPGSNIIPGSQIHMTMVGPILGRFPITLHDL